MSEQNRIVPGWPSAPAGRAPAAAPLAGADPEPALALGLPLEPQPTASSPAAPTARPVNALRVTRDSCGFIDWPPGKAGSGEMPNPFGRTIRRPEGSCQGKGVKCAYRITASRAVHR